jgi:ethanolamine ammonia-lyase large subunit
MVAFRHTIHSRVYSFDDLRTLLAKASPARAADRLAEIAASDETERVAARFALSDLPLKHFLAEHVIPGDIDDVTRLIHEQHDPNAFAPIASLTVGELRDWLLSVDGDALAAVRFGLTPEMVAAASKLMRNQDLIAIARKCEVVTRFRNTLGLRGRLRRGSNPIIRPTIRAASPRACSTASCSEAAML